MASPPPNPFEGDEWEDFVDRVIDGLVPQLRDTTMVASIIPNDMRGDVKFWVELGASIMMNKPIVAVCFNDQPLPPKLAMIVDEVIRVPRGDTVAAADQLEAALRRITSE